MNYLKAAAILLSVLPAMFGQNSPDSNLPSLSQAATENESKPKERVTLDANDPAAKNEDKRVLGVLPNYRTAELTVDYHPISAGYKMHIALKDSFDYPLLGLGAAYAGLFQAEDSHHQFGQGTVGYLHRFGTSYTDQIIGNMLTEGILPAAFREDPRYFRMAEGLKKKRALYALTRIFVTRTDSGARTFNFAEIIGNGAAAAIGLSYYTDDRNFPDYAENVGLQLATDAISQVIKEFWPDVKRHYSHRHKAADLPLAQSLYR